MPALETSEEKSVLAKPVTALWGVGGERAAQLAKLGVRSVEDLILHRPRRYDFISGVYTEGADRQKFFYSFELRRRLRSAKFSIPGAKITPGLISPVSLACGTGSSAHSPPANLADSARPSCPNPTVAEPRAKQAVSIRRF